MSRCSSVCDFVHWCAVEEFINKKGEGYHLLSLNSEKGLSSRKISLRGEEFAVGTSTVYQLCLAFGEDGFGR